MRSGSIRRPTKQLTAKFVQNVNEPGKHFDGHGLFLKVTPALSKQWVQRIHYNSKRHEIGLGSAELVTLAEARAQALENRRIAQQGGDPLQEKKQNREILSFEDSARKVYEINAPTWRSTKHGKQFIATLETYVFPHIGRKSIADISQADLLTVLLPIWLDKAETARRVRQRIGTVMKWGIAQGWRQDNPVENIAHALPKQNDAKKQRKSLPYQDVSDFMAHIHKSHAGEATKLALEFLILNASRSGEVRNARWEEVENWSPANAANLANRDDTSSGVAPANYANSAKRPMWIIPPERIKTKREHRIPLSSRALFLLEQAHKLSDGSGLIFPGAREGRPLSENTLNKLVKELGFDIHIHGFRTSFRVWTQEQTNTPREVAEAALAHTIKNKAEAAYARSDLLEKRHQLMQAWADYIAAEPATVVRLAT